jgi:hypothetical protein
MNKQDDYIVGPHNYWLHFWLGGVMGLGLGWWVGFNIFEAGLGVLAIAVTAAVIVAFSCGRWGDRAWRWIIQRLHWLT